MTRYFDNIPEKQITRKEWQHPFVRLANSGRTTTWGLKDSDKRLLGLCVMLEETEYQAARASQIESNLLANLKAERNKVKGLQLENGRLKSKVKKLDEVIDKLNKQALTWVMDREAGVLAVDLLQKELEVLRKLSKFDDAPSRTG